VKALAAYLPRRAVTTRCRYASLTALARDTWSDIARTAIPYGFGLIECRFRTARPHWRPIARWWGGVFGPTNTPPRMVLRFLRALAGLALRSIDSKSPCQIWIKVPNPASIAVQRSENRIGDRRLARRTHRLGPAGWVQMSVTARTHTRSFC
jgi:hypothetical protein